MGRIVVIGNSNTDMVVQTPHFPGPGETVLGGTFFQAADGKSANQVVAAARAGRTVILNPAPAQPLPEDLWADITVLTPNQTEEEFLSGGSLKEK